MTTGVENPEPDCTSRIKPRRKGKAISQLFLLAFFMIEKFELKKLDDRQPASTLWAYFPRAGYGRMAAGSGTQVIAFEDLNPEKEDE